MPWYWIALVVCLVVGPFDALYMYIKSEKRRDALKRKQEKAENGKTGEDNEQKS